MKRARINEAITPRVLQKKKEKKQKKEGGKYEWKKNIKKEADKQTAL